MMKVLVDLGADMNQKNLYGLNVLHIAAQGDSPVSIYFFHRIHKLGLNSTDSRGSTPLHWACFSMSELSMIYLIAWMKPEELNLRDNDGYSALHIAVRATEKQQSKNGRSVKALLYRGASTEIRDNNGNRPLEEVQKLNSISLRTELEGYLQHRGGLGELLMVKTSLKKIDKSMKLPSMFFLFNLVVYACLLGFIFPRK